MTEILEAPYTKVNQEVLMSNTDIVTVSNHDLTMVRDMALTNVRGRARLCAHQSADDPIHEMLIALVKESYIPPHKHLGKSESFHMIEGSLIVIVFDDSGIPIEYISLASPGSADAEGQALYYRLSKPMYHTVIPMSDVVVFHETTNGPFRRGDTVFAEWAPCEQDDVQIQRAYISQLLKQS